MSIKIYLLSLFLILCGTIVRHYKNQDLPIPLFGDLSGEDEFFPLHCMFFSAALVATWLNIEMEDIESED
jgi:hypothetical protein